MLLKLKKAQLVAPCVKLISLILNLCNKKINIALELQN